MRTLNVIIERSENNYSAYLQEVDGVIAVGKSVAEIKQSLIEAIDVLIESCNELGCEIPMELQGDYTLSFKMDVRSVLDFYSNIFTKAALERITGINQKQLWHYASGERVPRAEQAVKLENALHKLGEELLSIQL
jgi:predicted RNase H-like HicB family nuclease